MICQLLSYIPRSLLGESVGEHQSDHYYKTMTTFNQWVFLFYGVVMRCKSLNNLCKNLLLLEDKLTYLGIREFPSVSTLSDVLTVPVMSLPLCMRSAMRSTKLLASLPYVILSKS
ncbi:MAG: DUF4372 domain-containing protein [Bacteroidota bacterium]